MLINTKNLHTALKFVGTTVSKSSNLAVVLLQFGLEKCSLVTTDLQGTSQISVPCRAETTGEYLVVFSALTQYVDFAAKADVEIIKFTEKNGKLVLTAAQGKYTQLSLPTIDPSYFPRINTEFECSYVVDVDFVTKLKTCASFTHIDRIPLNAISISPGCLEATDGFTGVRVLCDTDNLEKQVNVSPTVIRSLQDILKIVNVDQLNVQQTKNSLTFFGDGWFVSTQTIDGNYPNISKGFANSGANYLTFDLKELKLLLGSMKISGEDVEITINYDTVRFSVHGEMPTHREFSIPEGELPNKFSVRIDRLLVILNAMRGETVSMKIGSVTEPIIIEEDDTVFFIVCLR